MQSQGEEVGEVTREGRRESDDVLIGASALIFFDDWKDWRRTLTAYSALYRFLREALVPSVECARFCLSTLVLFLLCAGYHLWFAPGKGV